MSDSTVVLTVVLTQVASYLIQQVEKTLKMKKKWSRNGKGIKQGRNVYDVHAM